MAGFQGRAMAGSQGRAMAGSQGMAEAGEAPLPSLHMDTEEDDNEYNEYEEADPGYLTNMFGSLFGVARLSAPVKRQLTVNWHRIVRRWYPDFHRQIYCSPPLHFNALAFKPKPPKPQVRSEAYLRYGMRLYAPARYSNVKSDESQQRLLGTLIAFARMKGLVPQFLVSNMEFQNYLNKDYQWADPSIKTVMRRPDISLTTEEGEVDILIIDKAHGVFVLEVKAIGDLEEIWDLEADCDEKKFGELHEKFKKKIGVQVEKGKIVINKLLSDLKPKINVRAGFALVNVKRDFFEKALDKFDGKLRVELLGRVDVPDVQTLSSITLCSDDLPPKYTPLDGVMTPDIFRSVDRVWNNFLKLDGGGEDRPMSDDLYERVVARFCGPLTTVKIYTEKSYPRVKLEIIQKKRKGRKGKGEAKVKLISEEALTKAGAARVMARRFSELVLLQEQIELLQRNEDFAHLEGPPGTGKTLMLLLRILTWLEDGHMVWIVSLAPPSRSVSHVLMEQVKKMVAMHKTRGTTETILKRLRMFMMIRPENTLDKDYFKRRLAKFRMRAMSDPGRGRDEDYPQADTLPSLTPEHDRKVCLALDETGLAGKGLKDFFQWVADLHLQNFFRCKTFDQGLSVWSASVERTGRPMYATAPGQTDRDKFGVIWDLKMPLRCPPSVQRALILVQPSLDQKNICCFTEEMTLSHPAKQTGTSDREIYAADGLPVFLIGHGSHKDKHRDIWFCYECGDELADYLQNVLHIGEEECECPGKPVIYDFEEDTPKTCPDCQKLTKGSLPAADLPLKFNDVMIVATQRAFQFSIPIGKFVLAMKKRNLKVAINTAREEGQAPIPDDDVILIADVTSVHGLERAVVIIVPEVNDPKPLPDKYRGILYPEPPLLSDVRRKKAREEEEELPQDLQDAIDSGRKDGKDGITVTAYGVVEDDDSPDIVTEDKGDHSFSSERGKVKAEGGGVAKDELEDMEAEEAEGKAGGSDDPEDPRRTPPPSQGAPPSGPQSATEDLGGEACASSPDPAPPEAKEEEEEDSAPWEFKAREIPYTYNDSFSKSEITAALMSLSPQSRHDVFYIGSRAVCQMILIHLGRNTRKLHAPDPPPDQPMDTDQ